MILMIDFWERAVFEIIDFIDVNEHEFSMSNADGHKLFWNFL